MRASEVNRFTISEVAKLIRSRAVSPVDVTQATLHRIERGDAALNAYITVTKDAAMRAAEAAEEAIASGRYRGPLHGVPLALKDLFATKGIRTTAGSKILAQHVPTYDATVVERLTRAGAILVGKLNLYEFACGGIVNPTYGATRNPWDLERTAGGSSGGAGAAVAASLCFGALGTDTGGSIRIPSSLCGIVGVKPTYGRVSRFGVTPLSWSLDHVGPMTRSVEDAAILLQAIAGTDPHDPTTARLPVPNYREALTGAVEGLTVGVPREFFLDRVEEEVAEAFHTAVTRLEGLGAAVEAVTVPQIRYTDTLYDVIQLCEAAAYHERYLTSHAQEYDPQVLARVQEGRFIPAVHYLTAQRLRRVYSKALEKPFERVDVIATPTTPIPAFKIGEETLRIGTTTENARRALRRLTRPFNIAGLPAVTVPCGFTATGLPIGLQIVAKPFDEATALRVAHAYETNTPWHQQRPPMDFFAVSS
jgi:aspartyl-tRNA(Asn)/glutamyl-tRNA(Gln) amidotransferase subunit A